MSFLKNNKNHIIVFSLFALFVMLNPSVAAAAPTDIEQTLCDILKILTGTAGKAIAVFALVFLGISLFLGKVSWGLAVSTALGIATIFGAPQLVGVLGAKKGLNLSTCESMA
jgi:type IV secretory pathway VirB2 component (pilin)